MEKPLQEKQNIGSLFDRIAGTYDALNHILSLNIDKRWRRKTVAFLPKASSTTETHVLDVAIGTADLTLEILRQQKATHIVGLDLSTEMMRIGAEKVAKKKLSDRVTFTEGSALCMPFAEVQFDAVTCGFGVRNFSDLDKGLKEMYRVLRPQGRVVILEFSYPQNKLIAWGYDLYFSHILPWIGRLVSRDKTAYTYLNRSVKHFVWGEEMAQHLHAAGFQKVQYQPLTLGIATIYVGEK